MIGGAALLADGMITPPISVTSAIEGLKQIPVFRDISQWTIVYIVIGILPYFFLFSNSEPLLSVRFFGPVMSVWFLMLAALGLVHFADDLSILKAFNPYYGIKLLIEYPAGFIFWVGSFSVPQVRKHCIPIWDIVVNGISGIRGFL